MNTVPNDRREKGVAFWYAFDNATLWKRTPEIAGAMAAAYAPFETGFDGPVETFRSSFASATHPAPFVASVSGGRDGFLQLAKLQLDIVRAHFGNDREAIRQAFEDFGQGVLYDSRPPRRTSTLVHQMDGTPDDWVGYHRWHANLRAAMLLGMTDPLVDHLLRCVALAWAIQTEADPPLDRQDNPGLPEDRRTALAGTWMNAPLETIDRAFALHRTRAPAGENLHPSTVPQDIASLHSPLTRYGKVQALLDAAAGMSRPSHQGYKRFWQLPLADFLAIGSLYGVQLVTMGRGAESGLVKALKGEPPFGPDGIPRMPMNRPPMDPADIAFIETWIDDGCPDDPPAA